MSADEERPAGPCPACLEPSGSVVHRFTTREAAQHFVLREEDRERHDALVSCIRALWGRDQCVVVRCASCGFVHADPYVAGDGRFYALAYPRVAYPRRRWEYGRTLRALDGTRPERALEIGAGAGFFLDRLPVDRRNVLALDLNEAACARLRAKGYTATADDVLTLEGGGCDAIFLFQVLEHMDRLDDHLQKLAQLARRDVFVSVPNGLRIEFNERHGGLLDMPPNHIGRWTPRAFEAAWGRHGFSIVEMEAQPGNLLELVKNDLAYRVLRLAQSPGSLSNRVRAMPRGARRRAMEATLAVAVAPSRLVAWVDGARRLSELGDAFWVHLRSPLAR